MSSFTLRVLPGSFAICKLPPSAAAPAEPTQTVFWSCTRTKNEVSVVCEQNLAPQESEQDTGWSMLYLDAQMELDIVGVLATLLAPLKEAGISIFAISTFDTDYLLIREQNLPRAMVVLAEAGYEVADRD